MSASLLRTLLTLVAWHRPFENAGGRPLDTTCWHRGVVQNWGYSWLTLPVSAGCPVSELCALRDFLTLSKPTFLHL